MNADEFLALKPNDRITNPMSGSSGVVSALVLDRRRLQEGVWIQWDGTPPDSAIRFTKHMTAWMHWTLPEPAC